MAFTTLTAGMRSLLSLWGTVQRAAAAFTGTAGFRDMVGSVVTFSETGMAEPTWTDYQAVYGLAVANRNALAAFERAGDDAFVGPGLIGLTPNARTAEAMATFPGVRLRVNYAMTVFGETVTGWVDIKRPGALTLTKRQLLDTLTTEVTTILAAHQTTPTYPVGTFAGIIGVTLQYY